MENQVFSDDIGAIVVQGAIVRFDLMVQSATQEDSSGKPKLVLQQRVVMPLDAFLRSAAKLLAVVQDLEKKGVVTRQPRKEGTKKADPEGPLI